MKQNCPNHDEFIPVLAKGLCAACYMRQRRRASASYVGKAGEHLRNRKAHPRAVAVVTPFGEFASASLAAERSPLTARTIQRYCQKQLNGYKYTQAQEEKENGS